MSTVSVRYLTTEDTYRKVVIQCVDGRGCTVSKDGANHFIVEYPNQDKFHEELARFNETEDLEALVEYEVLK